jgi:transmembrane sensor
LFYHLNRFACYLQVIEKMKGLIEKFWKDKCSLEEQKVLLEKLEDASELEHDLLNSYNATISAQQENSRKFYDELFLKIKTRINFLQEPKKTNNFIRFVLASAAMIIIAGTLFFFDKQSNSSAIKADQSISLLDKKIIESNTTTKDLSILLKDGSVVTLKPGSSFSYSHTYNARERNLTLIKGEACFKVTKRKNKPFTVNSNDILTTALGTKFTVSKTADSEVKIKLLEGKVVVRSTRKKKEHFIDTYLVPGQTLIARLAYGKFDLQNELKKAIKVPTVSVKIKKEYPDLIFDKELLSNVFNSLEQRYNVDIQYVSDPESSLSFTGSVKSGESLMEILSTICAMNNLTYSKDNNQIVIRKK